MKENLWNKVENVVTKGENAYNVFKSCLLQKRQKMSIWWKGGLRLLSQASVCQRDILKRGENGPKRHFLFFPHGCYICPFFHISNIINRRIWWRLKAFLWIHYLYVSWICKFVCMFVLLVSFLCCETASQRCIYNS